MTEEIVRESWWKRNWKWAVPVGGCLTLIVLLVVFVTSVFFGVSSMFKESTPYQDAKTQAEQHPLVMEHIGTPIETDGMMSGNISFSNNDGEANITMPVKGPKGEGQIVVVGTKTNGIWTYTEMSVTIDSTEQTIDLLEEGDQ